MHELPVMQSILNVVLSHAKQHNVRQVVAIHLDVGELSDLEDKWMQHYFDYLSKGSLAEKAKLKINRIPVTMKCKGCGKTYTVDLKANREIACPVCSEKGCEMIAGREYFIRNMEAI